MPLNIGDYTRFSVILINRTPDTSAVTLEVSDVEDRRRAWQREIPANGVRRFTITADDLAGLVPIELRMRIRGMPTPWGRPIVLKEFPSGVISVMHC